MFCFLGKSSVLKQKDIRHRIRSHQSLKDSVVLTPISLPLLSLCQYCLGYYSSSICRRIRFTHMHAHAHTHADQHTHGNSGFRKNKTPAAMHLTSKKNYSDTNAIFAFFFIKSTFKIYSQTMRRMDGCEI